IIQYPSVSIRSICSFLGINFSEEMLDYSDNKEYVGLLGDQITVQKSNGILKGKPVSTTSVPSKYDKYLQGYSHFLGPSFLSQYGKYALPHKSRKTLMFSLLHYFSNKLHFPDNTKGNYKYMSDSIFSFPFIIRYI